MIKQDDRLTPEGLYHAYVQCRRGKRHKADTQCYEMQLMDNLYAAHDAITAQAYTPALAMRFLAQKPKAREIYAAHFSDRVIHHWLVPRLEVLYEPVFVYDVYSNRKGKGIHAAVARLQRFMRQFAAQKGSTGYYMQLDIHNFFNSIHKPTLYALLKQRLHKLTQKGKLSEDYAYQLQWLVWCILKHSPTAQAENQSSATDWQRVPAHKLLENAQAGCGLPIGNLTSQFFANVYMNELDQFVKHQLKAKYYLRYVDDFILLAKSSSQLMRWQTAIQQFLAHRLQLALKAQVSPQPVTHGADFLGYICYPQHKQVRRRVIHHVHEKLLCFEKQHVLGSANAGWCVQLTWQSVQTLHAQLNSFFAHAKHAQSYHLLQKLFKRFMWLQLLFTWQYVKKVLSLTPLYVMYAPSFYQQCRKLQARYPHAHCMVQKGYEYIQLPKSTATVPATQATVCSQVLQVQVCEAGLQPKKYASTHKARHNTKHKAKHKPPKNNHSHRPLKRRFVSKLIIDQGVTLCMY